MTQCRFDPREGVIRLRVQVVGPTGSCDFTFALDTGASTSLLSWQGALYLGYTPEMTTKRRAIVTGSSVEYCPELRVHRIVALGRARSDFPILCHTLPPQARLQGLLGLDFLAGSRLSVDFRKGVVRLA